VVWLDGFTGDENMSNHTNGNSIKDRYKDSDRRTYKREYPSKKMQARSWLNTKYWAVNQTRKKKKGRLSVKRAAEIIGVSTTSIYNWRNAVSHGGKDALRPQSKRPHIIHRIDKDKEMRIIEIKKDTGLGCEKVAIEVPTSNMTVWRYCTKHGIIKKEKFKRRKWKLFERKHSNTMWQIDYAELIEGVWSISILDDHSRFICGFEILDHVPTTDDTVQLLERAFSLYGAPRQILTDHGAQFCSAIPEGVSSFDLWCRDNYIRHLKASIRRPTTIGKVEAWHRTLRQECIDKLDEQCLDSLRKACYEFVQYYNLHRTHFAYVIYDFYGLKKKRKVAFIPYLRFVSHRRPDEPGDRIHKGGT
jgi:transposase